MTNNGDLHDINSPPVEGVGGGGTAYGWIDGDLRCSSLCKGSKDSSELPSSDMMHAWFMPNTATVGSQEIPRPLEPITLLAARNERESVQIAVRPKVSWGGPAIAGSVQIHCTDLCSISGARLIVGESLNLRRVVPVLGFPDALVPLELPTSHINLIPGETTAIWLSIVVPSAQPPGRYDGEILLTAIKADTDSVAPRFGRSERCQLFSELRDCLNVIEVTDGRSQDEMGAIINSTRISLKKILTSSSFSEFYLMNAPTDMEEDARSNFSICLKLSLTVWDFVLPATPSLPAIFGISDTVIEDRFGVEHGSDEWYEALELHFKWILQYRISPYFCRWGESMRVLTYTCPWPADHPKSDEYFSDPRLAAYAVPYNKIFSRSGDEEAGYLQKQINILRRKEHWKKAYFYLWDEPLNMEQYDSLRHMASEIHAYAPDSRILTTYYCGPNDAPLAPTTFESFLKVPKFLRPHTQIYCTSEWVLGNREDLVKDIVSEIQTDSGEEWWSYICMGPSDPHPNWHLGMRGTQHRAVMWRVWKEGCSGFLYWGANCYEKATVPSAEIKFRRGLPPGDGVLFYPGQVFSHHQPVASVRLERLLSGLQDIEYLRLYESRYGRNEAMLLLERTGVYLGPERYTQEHGPIDVMRSEIFNACRC